MFGSAQNGTGRNILKRPGSHRARIVIPADAIFDFALDGGAVALTVFALPVERKEDSFVDANQDEIVFATAE